MKHHRAVSQKSVNCRRLRPDSSFKSQATNKRACAHQHLLKLERQIRLVPTQKAQQTDKDQCGQQK